MSLSSKSSTWSLLWLPDLRTGSGSGVADGARMGAGGPKRKASGVPDRSGTPQNPAKRKASGVPDGHGTGVPECRCAGPPAKTQGFRCTGPYRTDPIHPKPCKTQGFGCTGRSGTPKTLQNARLRVYRTGPVQCTGRVRYRCARPVPYRCTGPVRYAMAKRKASGVPDGSGTGVPDGSGTGRYTCVGSAWGPSGTPLRAGPADQRPRPTTNDNDNNDNNNNTTKTTTTTAAAAAATTTTTTMGTTIALNLMCVGESSVCVA